MRTNQVNAKSKKTYCFHRVALNFLFIILGLQSLPANATDLKFGENHAQFNILSSSAADAIEIFAQQTGLQFLFQSRLLSGVNTQAIIGSYSQANALELLLAGSQVEAEFVATDIVILRARKATPKRAPIQPVQLIAAKPSRQELQTRPAPIVLDDQIVVTARRRPERLHDHPGAVKSFNAIDLENARVDGIEDIVARTSNTLVEERPGAEINVFIRGAGTATNGSATRTDSAIGIYYDGIYTYLAGSRIPLLFYDMDRIEILKGPQGGLYGRNTIGGAIIAQSSKPVNGRSQSLRLEIGEHNSRLVDGHINIPISDTLWVRASGIYQNRDSYYTNVDAAKTERGDQTIAGRLKARFRPNASFDAILSYEKITEDKGPVIAVPITAGERHISATTTGGKLSRTVERLSTNIAWNGFDNAEFRLIAGTANTRSNALSDFNNITADPESGEFQIAEQKRNLDAKQSSIDLIFKSTNHSPFQWLTGISYFEDTQNMSSFSRQGFPTNGINNSEIFAQNTISMGAAFVDISYDFSESITLNTSLRYSSEERTGGSSNSATLTNNNTVLPTPNIEYAVHYSKLSPEISISYDFDDHIMAYAKITTGYQSGGVNTRTATQALSTFGPSTAINYEAGLHSEWLGRRLVVNTSVFLLNQDNFQFQSDNPPFNEFVNTGTARTTGLELDMIAKPFEWLQVDARYGYLDARTHNIPNSAFGNLSGERKLGTPRHTASIGMDIRAPILNGKVDLNIKTNYTIVRDRFLGDFAIQLDDYSLFDVRAGIEFKNDTLVYLFAQNLFNDIHTITPVTLDAIEISPPRLAGIGVSLKF